MESSSAHVPLVAGLALVACGASVGRVDAEELDSAPPVEVEIDLHDLSARAWLPFAHDDPAFAAHLHELDVRAVRPASRAGAEGVEVDYTIDRAALGDADTTLYTAFQSPRWMPTQLRSAASSQLMLTIRDPAFFAGVRRYTRANWDRGAETEDLFESLQGETTTRLRPLFRRLGAGAQTSR
ncbi:MAG: hypothetical protein AB8I08_09495 [Sandaracinaceae bacterium]